MSDPVNDLDDLETAIVNFLGKGADANSPFATVVGELAGMSDTELAEELAKYGKGGISPAALVLPIGGDVMYDVAGCVYEKAEVQVAVIAAQADRKTATKAAYALITYVRDRIRDKDGNEMAGIKNPLSYLGWGRMRIPNVPLSVAAFVVRFHAPMDLKRDGA